MAIERIQTGIRFQPETLQKLAYIAKANHRSLNAQLETLAEHCIDQYERDHGKIIIDEK